MDTITEKFEEQWDYEKSRPLMELFAIPYGPRRFFGLLAPAPPTEDEIRRAVARHFFRIGFIVGSGQKASHNK